MTTRLCFAAFQVSFSSTSTTLSVTGLGALRSQVLDALPLHKWSKLPQRILSVHAACIGEAAVIAGELDTLGEESIENHTERASTEVVDANKLAPGDASVQVSIHDLRIGSIYKGRVTTIESYGAFVDIGTYFHGFIHISRLGRSMVRRVEDVLQVGQDVTVQIVDLDLNTNHMSLVLRPYQGLQKNFGLPPLSISSQDIAHRVAVRRANKLASRAQDPLPRRSTSLESRRRLKAYRRTAMAERQAIEIYCMKTKASSSSSVSMADELKPNFSIEGSSGDRSGSPEGVSTGEEIRHTPDNESISGTAISYEGENYW